MAAADTNSMTLTDYALISNDPLVQKITFSLLENGNIMQDIPLITRASLKASGKRYTDGLPSVGWRKINEAPAVVKSVPQDFEEQAFTLSNAFDIDKKLQRDVNQIQDPFSIELAAYLKAVTYDMNDKAINNNHVTGDEDAPVGFRARLDNAADFGLASECKIDAAGVDMSPGGLNATTANSFIEYLQTLLDYMGATEGDGVVLYMNDVMKRRFSRAVRVLGGGAGWQTTADAFGRTVEMFKNAKVRDIGRKGDQNTRIITNTETAAGLNGASTFTSIYGVKYGEEDAFKGWQFDTLEESLIGPYQLENGVQERLVVDWTVGFFQENHRAVARLYDIKIA